MTKTATDVQIDIIPTPDPLGALFAQLGIAAVTYAHPAVFTVAEGEGFKHRIPGGHTKNLFLKDKKDQLWLVTAAAYTAVDLKGLPELIGAGRLSFGSPERLLDALGVPPGSVTPLALLNDTQRRVRFVLDEKLTQCSTVNCHPLRNDMTTCLAPQDLLRFLQHLGYDPLVAQLEKPA
jgi:Ala-tRNA(Pro) deacylase